MFVEHEPPGLSRLDRDSSVRHPDLPPTESETDVACAYFDILPGLKAEDSYCVQTET